MEVAAVFILSVIGGWAFAMRWRLTRYTMLRSDGEHTYFRAALYGVVIFVVTLLARIPLKVYWPAFDDLDDAMGGYAGRLLDTRADNAFSRDVVVTAAMSTVAGPLLAAALNLFTGRSWALRRAVSAQDRLLHDAQREEMPVSLTLLTNRTYVGIVVAIPDPLHPLPIITILPMYSGFRDATGRLVLTTDYERVYEVLGDDSARASLGLADDWSSDFELTIRADQVVTATMFIPAVYAHFNPKWRSSLTADPPPTAPLEVHATIDVASVPPPRRPRNQRRA